MSFLDKIENVAKTIEHGLVAAFHAIEHEVPRLLSHLTDIYGPQVIATAIATHKAGVEMYADKAIETAEADTKALVQSTLAQKFGLPPTLGQLLASAIHHVFTVGEDKVNSLIDLGAAKAIAATGATDTAGSTTTAPTP